MIALQLFLYITKNKYIEVLFSQLGMISIDHTTEFQQNDNSHRKPNSRDRFKKYKSLMESRKAITNEQKMQHIFSHFYYTPIELKSTLKDSISTKPERASTIESELEETFDNQQSTSFLSCSSVIFSNFSLSPEPTPEGSSLKPEFVQEFSRLNSITPNCMHPLYNAKQEMKNLNKLIKAALNSIHHTLDCALRLGNNRRSMKVFAAESLPQLTVQFFISFGWEKVKANKKFDSMRPKQNFESSLKFEEILSLLESILSKTARYQLAASLTQEISLELYNSIRQSLWQIEAQLIQCSNALYLLWNKHEYPEFYYKYLDILRSNQQMLPSQAKSLIDQFRQLWEIHEPVTCSEVGRAVWHKLHSLCIEQSN